MFYQNILLIGILRHLVATRTIEAGEIVLKENPLIFGPEGQNAVCLGCYQKVTKNSPRCQKCGFPVCSKDCADLEMHRTFECEVLMKNGWFKTQSRDYFFESPENFYAMIAVLRTFLLQEKDPDCWALIWSLESHKTKKKSRWFLRYVESLVGLLQRSIGLREEDISTITTIIDIHQTNILSKSEACVLYGLASMPMHDCLFNTGYDISSVEEGFAVTFKATRTIKEGEDITLSYRNSPWLTVLEWQKVVANKCFVVIKFVILLRLIQKVVFKVGNR
jgi:hypothetical protein